VTAHAAAEERAASLAAGMDDQLVKPILQEELVRAVLRHLRRRTPRRLPQKTA
jgi:DNA-binding response OmpR family regulator